MQKLSETICVDVFSLHSHFASQFYLNAYINIIIDPKKKLDEPMFQRLKSDINQQIQAQKQCHCTICGQNLFNTIFVFDGYSCFWEIKRSVYVFVTVEREDTPRVDAAKEIALEQSRALIKYIERQKLSERKMAIEEELELPQELEKIAELFPPLSDIIFQPNQEIPIDDEQQKKNRLKTLMLRQKFAIFQPLKHQLHFFNDQVFDIIVGYTNEKTKEEHADYLMNLMKGWTLRDYLIEKKYAQYCELNKKLKEKFDIEDSIELSEDKFNLKSDESSDSQVIVRLRQKTEELQNLAKKYLGDQPESE